MQNSTDVPRNVRTMRKCLALLALKDVNLVVFPECSLTGFSPKLTASTPAELGGYIDEFSQWSRDHDIAVVLPTALTDGAIYNTGFYIHQGKATPFYKLGLTPSETGFFSTPADYTKSVFSLRGFRFLPLICMEAQQDPWTYFKPGDVDFLLWPGYWGWEKDDLWSPLKKDGDPNPIFQNVAQWRVPLIQANFAYNEGKAPEIRGPHGLSRVVGSDNTLCFQAAFHRESCFWFTLEKSADACVVSGFRELVMEPAYTQNA
nr:carbon-nitrogen hydrolase family protein [Lujinxingia vulgaris]